MCVNLLVLFLLLLTLPARAQTLLLAGDLQVERLVRLAALRPWTQGVDLFMVNLEGPLSARPFLPLEKTWKLRSTPVLSQALPALGPVLGILANNHAGDCGAGGLEDTRQSLSTAGDPEAITVSSQAGFRLVCANLVPPRELDLETPVRQAQPPVVVWLHWNAEEWLLPPPEDRALAHRLIDAGACLVVGTHPHLPGPVERYRGRLIFYSLGNLAVECPCSQLDEGIVARVTLAGEGQLLTLHPGNLANGMEPSPAPLPSLLDGLRDLSAELGTVIEPDGRIR